MNYLDSTICIASYPRSGNTFMRNIFMDVFGVYSWNSFQRYLFLKESLEHPFSRARDRYYLNDRLWSPAELQQVIPSKVFKTHELPALSDPILELSPFVILIIRDGRDAVISEAYHRKDIIEPGSDFSENLREAIIAAEGSHFGGWSENVKAWIPRADLVLHFEQLITDPVRCIRKIASLVSLPPPDMEKIPTFESQRSGAGRFVTLNKAVHYHDTFPRLFFRKGMVGEWRREMPEEMQRLFMQLHGDTLSDLGYLKDSPEELKFFI